MISKMVTIFSLAMALAISAPQLASAHGGGGGFGGGHFGGGFSGGHFGGGSFGGGISHFSGDSFGGGHFASAHVGGVGGVGHFSGAHVGHGHFADGRFGGRHFAFRRHGRDFFFFDGPYDEGYYDGYDYDDDACYENVHTRRGWRWVWICD